MSTVGALFDEKAAAERAVRDLIEAGFSADSISLIAAGDRLPGGQIVYETGTSAPEGIATGASAGALIGGAFGLLVGATVIAFPGAALLAAGPLAGLLSGAVIGAASGGLLGGLIGLGIPRTHAEVYAEGVRRGGVVVTVECEQERCLNAERILGDNGAVDIEERQSYYRAAGWSGYDAQAPSYTAEEIARERENLASRGYAVPPNPPRIGEVASGPTLEIASMEPFFRSDYLTRFGAEGAEYAEFAPAYRWGYQLSSSSLYARSFWSDVEPNLRADWERVNPGTWAVYAGAVRYAWDRARVRTGGAEVL